MAITATTLSGAINATQASFGLTAVTGISNPTGPTGLGNTWLLVDGEIMFVTSVNTVTLVVNVLRGQYGTQSIAHATTGSVLIGTATDFPNFQPTVTAFATSSTYAGMSAPVASATSVTATGKRFHVTGTTTITNMVPPSSVVEGVVSIIFDGVAAITASGTATGNAFAVNCTPTTALSTIDFYLDQATGLWYPSRLS